MEQIDCRQLKHKGKINPALHEFRTNQLLFELQHQKSIQSVSSPSATASLSTPCGPSQLLEALATAVTNSVATTTAGKRERGGNPRTLQCKEENEADEGHFATSTAREGAMCPPVATGTSSDKSGGVATTTTANYIKQEGGPSGGQSSKFMQGQSTSVSSAVATISPQQQQNMYSAGVGGAMGVARTMAGQQQQSVPAQVKVLERPKSEGSSPTSLDTPLTHFRTGRGGGKIITSFSSGQRSSGTSSGSNAHPLATAVTRHDRLEDQCSGQVSGQSVRTTKGPVTRSSTGRSLSPAPTNTDALPMTSSSASSSPSERNTISAEKPPGLSSEEARRLRQAQQRLQKEQWMKKYGQGSSTGATSPKGVGEIQGEAASDGGESKRLEVQTSEEMIDGTDVLISDGKQLNLSFCGHQNITTLSCLSVPTACAM